MKKDLRISYWKGCISRKKSQINYLEGLITDLGLEIKRFQMKIDSAERSSQTKPPSSESDP